MVKVRVGQRVRYRVGRGWSIGKVIEKDGDFAVVQTANGKALRREIAALQPPSVSEETSDQPHR